MCRFKRLVAKARRRIGWTRKQKAPAVTRPSDTEIKLAKKKADRNNDRSKRRRIAREAKEEEARRNLFLQQKGLAT